MIDINGIEFLDQVKETLEGYELTEALDFLKQQMKQMQETDPNNPVKLIQLEKYLEKKIQVSKEQANE